LSYNDGSRGRVGLCVVFGFLAIALNIMAVGIFKLLLYAALDPDVIPARPAIPVTVAISRPVGFALPVTVSLVKGVARAVAAMS
jgi:hypothetical protein